MTTRSPKRVMSPVGNVSPPSIALLRALRSAPCIQTFYGPLRSSCTRPIARPVVYRCRPDIRSLSTSASKHEPQSSLPATNDRGPKSTEDTVTDFNTMDVLSSTPAPTTAIDACLSDGFHFDNGLKISGGSGCLLVGGEAFSWRPWEAPGNRKGLLNAKGQWEVGSEAWGLLDLLWPKPGRAVRFSIILLTTAKP